MNTQLLFCPKFDIGAEDWAAGRIMHVWLHFEETLYMQIRIYKESISYYYYYYYNFVTYAQLLSCMPACKTYLWYTCQVRYRQNFRENNTS